MDRLVLTALTGSYQDLLEGDRDAAVDMIATRLKWFGEDCLAVSARIRENPPTGIGLVLVLSSIMQDLDRMSGIVQARQGTSRDANQWASAHHEGTDTERRTQREAVGAADGERG